MSSASRKRSNKMKNVENLSNDSSSDKKFSTPGKTASGKIKKKNMKTHGLSSQDQVHKNRRNMMFIAVLIYIAIGAGVLVWKGLTKLPEIPPELENEILGSYPQHLKDIDMPKNIKKKSAEKIGIKDEKALHSKTLNELTLSSITSDAEENARSWIEVTSQKTKSSPVRVHFMDDFLSSQECDELTKLHESNLLKSKHLVPSVCFSDDKSMRSYLDRTGASWTKGVASSDFIDGSNCLNESLSSRLVGLLPWSFTTSFNAVQSPIFVRIEETLEKHAGLTIGNGADIQITSFEKDVKRDLYETCASNSDTGGRFAAILIFLQDVEGGEVEFEDLDVRVKPRKGRIVVWNNMDSDRKCHSSSYHRALPVTKGKGLILQRWYYQQSPPAVSKRRASPYVECREFDSGSCRWHDA